MMSGCYLRAVRIRAKETNKKKKTPENLLATRAMMTKIVVLRP